MGQFNMAAKVGFCKWRLKMLSLFYLLFLIGFVHGRKQSQWLHRTTRGVQSEYYTQTRRMSWWNASENGCDTDRSHGKLLTREIEDRLVNFRDGRYWVGAIAFPQWKWSDGSPLYTYKGYNNLMYVKNYNKGYLEITGNSVSKCHSFCKKRSSYTVGLKGRYCFCLVTYGTHSSYVTGEHESPCPGNPLEKCGGQHGVSVYTADSFLPDPTSAGDCTFLKEDNSWNYFYNTYLVARTESCAVSKCAVCYGQISITDHSSTKQSWDQWNRTCDLYKVTDDRLQQLKTTLAHSIYRHECRDGYWIGLRRYTAKKWLSGEDANIGYVPNIGYEGTANPYCLTLQKYWHGYHNLEWTNCSENLPSICETVQPSPTISSTVHPKKSTPPRVYSTMTPRTTKINPSISHPWRSTLRRGNVTRTSVNTFKPTTPQSPKGQRDDARYEEHSSNTGVYIGTFLGLLILIALILVLGFSYRRKKFCFKQSKPDEEHVYFDPSHGGMVDSSNHAMSQPTSNPVYCIPVATIKPTYQNPGFRGDEGTDYYNVSPKLKAETLHKHDDKGYQYEVPTTTDNKQGSTGRSSTGDNVHGEMESHYEVPKSGVDSNQEWDGDGWDEDEWDDDTNEEQNIYTLAGKGMEEKRWTEADTLPLNCRSGFHGRHAANDCYNTLGENLPAAAPHNVYNHISDVNGTENCDASYDTAFQRDVRALDDDYCHTEAFKSGEDPKNHGSKTSKPRINNIGIYENTNNFEGGIYENIDASGKESSNA